MRIELCGANNTRDLGGIITADGRTIRKKRLIRSGALSHLTKDDISVLRQHDLLRVIDLRTPAEQRQRPDVPIENVEYISLPLISDQAIGVTRERNVIEQMVLMASDPDFCAERYMQGIYADFIINERSSAQLKHFFELLADTPKGAVLWHCSAGKDRVGVTTALLLTILGADRDTVFRDYLHTNDYLSQDVAPAATAVHRKLTDTHTLESITEMVTTLYTVKQSYLQSVFEAMENSCGSIENYLREKLGITDAARDHLRKLYLEQS